MTFYSSNKQDLDYIICLDVRKRILDWLEICKNNKELQLSQ